MSTKTRPAAESRENMKLTESKLFQRTTAGLRIEEEDNAKLEEDPATVNGKVSPGDCAEGDGVDVGGEETSELAKNLLNANTAASLGIRPELDQVS